MKIRELLPGDRVSGGAGGGFATLISWSTPHPMWPGLALVVWRMRDGRLQLDALDPEYTAPTVHRVEQTEDQRMASLRSAIDGAPLS